MQLTARKRRVASPWGRQAPGSACDRLLPPPGRVAEPQRRAVLTLPQPRDRRGERFYEHARHPAHVRRPANHLYGLVRGEGSAVVRYGEPLRGAAPGSEPKSGTTPPSPRSRRYGSPMRVDHSVNHDAPGLRRTERVLRYRTPEPRLWGRFSPDLDGQTIQTDKRSRPVGRPVSFLFPIFLGGRASWPCPAFPSRTRAKLHVSPGGERCYRAGLGGSSNLSHTIAPSQKNAHRPRVGCKGDKQGSRSDSCDTSN